MPKVAPDTTPRRALQSQLTIYAFWLACAVVIIAGLVLIQQDHELTRQDVFSAVGLNLIAAAIFAVVFTLLSSRIQQRALEESLREQLDGFSTKVLQGVSALNPAYIPMAVYPAGESFGLDFNRHMTDSLMETEVYYFRGPSARYVPARLRACPHYPQQVRVAMLDPRETLAVSRRSADRQLWERLRDVDLATIERDMYEELYMTVVALFDYRHRCSVDLVYLPDPGVYRMELFDDSIYLSPYHSPLSSGRELPETYRFHSKSFLYRIIQQETARRFDVSRQRYRFHAGQDEQAIVDHMTELTGRSVTTEDIQTWRSSYDTYVRDFLAFLKRYGQG